MRWSIVRLIWARELRDQLRDRRTVFMIAVLPVLLYPVTGFGVLQLARGFLQQQTILGVQGSEHLPPLTPRSAALSPLPSLALLTATPAPPSVPGVERLIAALALAHARRTDPQDLDYPPLFLDEGGRLRFPTLYLDPDTDANLTVRRAGAAPALPAPADSEDPDPFLQAIDRGPLEARQVDLLLVIPPNFREQLDQGHQPPLYLLTRPNDDRSRLASVRVGAVLVRWKKWLTEVRLVRRGLPPGYDDPLTLRGGEPVRTGGRANTGGLFNLLGRVFPFILVLWSLAGALYPAVDLCAGEKERGTMETLLISPARREEIVWGKFLTIWVFSAVTALLNLLSMGLTAWQLGGQASAGVFRPLALFWGVLLLLPLSAFFSALCLSIGVYARSSKEGQYYLMPLFLLTMPLIFLTLAPGVELNPFYSMVPVTGVALLLQRLMAAGTPDRALTLYFVPVLAPMVVYSWLALRWAIEQFQREEVLFREAERLDLGLWLRGLFRDKEALPSAGQAFFCFGLVLGLRWLSFHFGTERSLLVRTAVGQLALVAAPALFMALLLTTRPLRGLALGWPPAWAWPAALLLAVLVWPPLAELTLYILRQFPALRPLLEQNHPLTAELGALAQRPALPAAELSPYFLALVLLPAVCEELAFRGFILSGLRRRLGPWTAILVSSFLFAAYQMNVFQLVPHFVFGVVLGVLVTRTGSLWPAILFHLVYNALAIGSVVLSVPLLDLESAYPVLYLLLVVTCAALALGIFLMLAPLGRAVGFPGHADAPVGHPGHAKAPAGDPGVASGGYSNGTTSGYF